MASEEVIILGERITRTEEKIDALKEQHETECSERKERDEELKALLEKVDSKVDHILNNDKDKLQRIASLETKWKILFGGGGLMALAFAAALIFI